MIDGASPRPRRSSSRVATVKTTIAALAAAGVITAGLAAQMAVGPRSGARRRQRQRAQAAGASQPQGRGPDRPAGARAGGHRHLVMTRAREHERRAGPVRHLSACARRASGACRRAAGAARLGGRRGRAAPPPAGTHTIRRPQRTQPAQRRPGDGAPRVRAGGGGDRGGALGGRAQPTASSIRR